MDTLVSAAAFGLILGIVVGMTSVGKGLLGTPGLVFLGMSAPVAVGTVGVAGVLMMVASALQHYRNSNVSLRTAWAFSLGAVPASFVFARHKAAINQVVPLTTIIAAAIILSVVALCCRFFCGEAQREASLDPKPARVVGLGAILGFFIGTTSISGSLIVVVLLLVLKMPTKLAIGTTSFIAVFSLAAASVAHVLEGHVDWWVLTAFAPAVMIGSYAGANLTNLLPQKPLQVIVVGLLFVAGVGMLSQNGIVAGENGQPPTARRADDISVTIQAASPAALR